MSHDDFLRFVQASVRRTLRRPNRIGGLVLTQVTKSKNPEPRIREPEMRHALAQEAEHQKNIFYGIEVPTKGSFRFTLVEGERKTSARHDFVVVNGRRHSSRRMNLLELKKDQPDTTGHGEDKDCPKVRKDFQKLIVEPAGDGKAMLHIFHAAKKKTVAAVLTKYNLAICQALRRCLPLVEGHDVPDPFVDDRWFTLFIFVVRRRRKEPGNQPVLYYRHFEHFGAALRQANSGAVLFKEGELQVLSLDEPPPAQAEESREAT
jgi:hypothetical protein